MMEEISAKFKQYDKNNDGFLSKAEVISYSNKDGRALSAGGDSLNDTFGGCLREGWYVI